MLLRREEEAGGVFWILHVDMDMGGGQLQLFRAVTPSEESATDGQLPAYRVCRKS